ncbi:MAG: exodeoxyribonuclease VII large subunit, partial [Candidatus Promineifilaceae bacterium]
DLDDLIRQKRWQVQTLARALTHLSPQARLDNNRQRLDVTSARLDRALTSQLVRVRNRLAVAEVGLTAVSPLATLSRGYAIVRRPDGRLVRAAAEVATGDSLTIQVADGQFTVEVRE